ncbi:hypothetical protein [Vibrio harveyi]|uniref:hypothetical protein n=1 Tax=Vibrio harveyi TaxID=669 RepID=UPI003CE7E8C9
MNFPQDSRAESSQNPALQNTAIDGTFTAKNGTTTAINGIFCAKASQTGSASLFQNRTR